MPINTDLNIAPYFDDYDTEDQFYKILFKPGYALQARELTQIQTILQNQIETFGDNIFQEGSIVRGCNFTKIAGLQYVKLKDTDSSGLAFNPSAFISKFVDEEINGVVKEVQYVYTFEGGDSGLTGQIIQAAQGYATRPPNLQTFFFQYTNNDANSNFGKLIDGELLTITLNKFDGDNNYSTTTVLQVAVSEQANHTGDSYGVQATPGIIFQKGHFLFTAEQNVIVEKYSGTPDLKSLGYEVTESLVTPLQDSQLYDNAQGNNNFNAPGADRLKLIPTLSTKETTVADADTNFFTLVRYKNGNVVTLRDVSQYNVLGKELARRTHEESGDYIIDKFKVKTERNANNQLQAIVGPGLAYVKGYRIQNHGELDFNIPNVTTTEEFENESVGMNYGHYLDTSSVVGDVPLDHTPVALKDGGGVQIGTAFVKNLTKRELYVFGINITDATKRFSDARQITADSGTAWGSIGFFNDQRIKETNSGALIFNTGVFSVSNTNDTSITVRTRLDGITYSANAFTITQPGGSGRDFDCKNTLNDAIFVRDDFQEINIATIETASNNSELNVTLNASAPQGTSGTGTLYHNERILLTQPYSKTVSRPFIKVSYSPTTSKYSLGFPDVFEIMSIVDSAGTSYLNSFRLRPNQKDTHYDISYMEYIPGRPQPTGTLTIRLKVFRINSSVGSYFFTINSYPIDDASEVLPTGQIRSNQLSVYEANNGKKFNLRECFDFRPYADKDPLADYNSSNGATAPTISTAADGYTLGFNADSHGTVLTPAVGDSITTDITSYNGRIDLIIVDSYGQFSYVQGSEDQNPKPPMIGPDQFIVAEVQVPGFPALSSREAGLQKKYNYAVRTKTSGIKRYTMADIAAVDDKVKRLEYYVTLNQLEQSVESLQILDANGLSRFKNGYVVDPLVDLRLADLENPEFNAAVPGDKQVMTPSLTTFPLDLTLSSSTGATIFPTTDNPEIATLSRNAHVSLINQPYATSYRTLTSNFYSYKGVGELFPDHDFVHDISVDPVPVVADLTAPIDAFIDDIQSFLPQTQVQTNNIGAVQVGNANQFLPGFVEQSIVTEFSTSSTTQQEDVGDFVSNVAFNPFIRSRDVNIYVSGLRPNTRHYFYFDGVSIDANVREASIANVTDGPAACFPAGNFGSAINSNAEGVITAIFRIPQNTFFVGERQVIITDVDDLTNVASASTSFAEMAYQSYNIDIGSRSLHTSTRIPQLDVTSTTTTRNVRGAARPQDNSNDNDNDWRAQFTNTDPLAQTFFIKEGEGKGSTTVFASKVDVYFKRKSNVNGVTLQLREVINGYPSAEILPFSNTHKHYSEVNVSDDSSVVTTFNFKSPVKLNTDTEYAIVLKPDANDPNYLAFTSKVGGNDLTPGSTQGKAVVQDWGDGVLFTSTNNKAWKSYQDEDLKFNIYRHDYNTAVGSVTLKSEGHEFLTIENFGSNTFTPNEYVYQTLTRDPSTGAAVSLPLGSTTLTGTGLNATYSEGDYIHVVAPSSSEDIFQIVQVVNDTSIILDHASYFSTSGGTGNPVAVGKVSFQNAKKPETLHLKDSSATGSKVFTAGSTITGLDSNYTADIVTVDNINLSYVHPLITAINDAVTTTSLSGNFTDPSNVNSNYNLNMKLAQENYFLNEGVVMYSRSNDTDDLRPFTLKVDMTNGDNSTSSPMVDINTASLIAYQYNVTDDSETTSKFITKRIDLAEDLDAEDMRVILTAYKPKDTDIKVYIRPLHAADSTSFETIDWIELELTKGSGQFCSTSNIQDYREFEYGIPAANLENDMLVYTSAGGTFTGYRTFALKIELLADSINNAPTVKDYRGIAIT